MRSPCLTRALLAAALSSFLVAQEPAVDLKQIRTQANEAVQSGDFTVAAANFKKLTEANPKDAQAWHMLGYSLHAAGKLDEALPIHMKAAEFKQMAPIATYNIACVHALKGKPDEAFAWLDKAVAAGFDNVDQLQGDEDFVSLRKDPRFAKVEASMKAKASAPQVQVFEQNIERRNARAAWFVKASSPCQIAIDWSPVQWKESHDKAVSSGKLTGQKWRLGSDFWTRLDTTTDLQCGSTAVPAGYYYMTLEQRDANTYVLALHDPAAVRKLKIDPGMCNKLQGGIEIAMTHTTGDEIAKTLDFTVATTNGSKTEGEITLRFGGHTLKTPFATKID